ncbi:hypothetical protein GCWU000324_02343 [Kingella oralis ATCC 51147]|uniref:Uncharacterized protein n=1 Tax=Kingella oralis ATCC 51147 TaxID=629741 RepID=C4GJW8_9NEIS|nr:hypothetical protein GCWU000324_02343 [Kingella oralis ATCC 51147]
MVGCGHGCCWDFCCADGFGFVTSFSGCLRLNQNRVRQPETQFGEAKTQHPIIALSGVGLIGKLFF